MATVSRSGRARAGVLDFPRSGRISRTAVGKMLPSGRVLVLGFALLAAAAAAYLGARETSLFAIRSIEISGAPPQVATHVRNALRPLEGSSLLAVGAADVGARLDRLPDVAAVSYDRSFPHTLRVTIVPAHSIAVLRRGPGAWIVSSSGRVVRSAGPFAAPHLPRIWVPRQVDVEVGSQLADADAVRAVTVLGVARRLGFAEPVRTVRAHDELTFVLDSGLELRFGDDTDFRAKLAVARAIRPQADGAGYLDVSAPDRPVTGTNAQVSG
jgi:cell division protein FtsQ